MELIFGFLPLPIAAAVIVAVGVAGYFVKKYVKNKAVIGVVSGVVDAVVTKARIDQTVERVLAVLKVRHELADKIGDLVAEIVVEVMGTQRTLSSKAAQIAEAVAADGTVLPSVATALVTHPTALNNVIVDVADSDIASDVASRALVASGVVRAYAKHTVL